MKQIGGEAKAIRELLSGQRYDIDDYQREQHWLPKRFNASYGDLPYDKKLEHYFGQNLLARSLRPNCYKHNPGFVAYVRESELPFHAHKHFKKDDLQERQDLYRALADERWDAGKLVEGQG